jgi:hypothetical protein
MTLEGWVDPTAGAAGGAWRAMAVKETAAGLAWALYPFGDTGLPSGHAFTANEQWAKGPTALTLNTWSHVAVTYDGTTVRMYVNGTLVGSKAQTGPLVTSSQPLRFGGDAVWPEWFQGALDEIRVYNRALSVTEIQADMTRPVSAASGARLGAARTSSKRAPVTHLRASKRHGKRNPGVQHIHYRGHGRHGARRAPSRRTAHATRGADGSST